MAEILVIGRATIDFNPIDLNKPLSESTTFRKYVGGSACNTAIGLQRQGQKVTMVSKVSDDQFGKFVLDYLQNEGICTKNIIIDSNHKIGLTFTEMISPTESSILMYRDEVADLKLSIEDVINLDIEKYEYIIISGTSLASETSREAVYYILSRAEQFNKKIVFDIDYRPYTWANKYSIALAYYTVALKAEIIVGSETEYKLMDEITKCSNVEEYAALFLNLKARHVVIKNGKEGSKYYSKTKILKVSIFPIDVLKSFGGGDAYMSTLVSGIINGIKIEDTLYKATAHASMLVKSHSCSQALSDDEAICQFIKMSKININDVISEVIKDRE